MEALNDYTTIHEIERFFEIVKDDKGTIKSGDNSPYNCVMQEVDNAIIEISKALVEDDSYSEVVHRILTALHSVRCELLEMKNAIEYNYIEED